MPQPLLVQMRDHRSSRDEARRIVILRAPGTEGPDGQWLSELVQAGDEVEPEEPTRLASFAARSKATQLSRCRTVADGCVPPHPRSLPLDGFRNGFRRGVVRSM